MSDAQVIPFPAHRIVREAEVSKKELAIRWGVSPKTIERMMARGLPFSRNGSGYSRFVLSECERWRREEEAS